MKNNIYNKIYKLQEEIGGITKNSKNPFYNSKYFDINDLIKQLHPLLLKHKLVLVQPITDSSVRSVIIDLDGGSIESSLKLTKGLDAQKKGSEITYYRRYTLVSLLCLQAEDDDGNKAITKVKPTLSYKDKYGKITKEFQNALEGIKNGKTINDIQSHYKLDSIIKERLLNFKLN